MVQHRTDPFANHGGGLVLGLAAAVALAAPGACGKMAGSTSAVTAAMQTAPLIESPPPDPGRRLLCSEERPCVDPREVWVDYDALGVSGRAGGEWISYDYHEVTRTLSATELAEEDELSLAVRLIISEVGADRMLVNRYGLLEGIGILYSVDNRLDRQASNPEARPEAPYYPGCGPSGSFYSCANAAEYLGMATWRALAPTTRYRSEMLEAATDVAVLAWWLQENAIVEDFTEGATSYVHRCGGSAYGMTTPHCDANMGRPWGDISGANPYTGPIVFKAPERFIERRGYYVLRESRIIDYEPWQPVEIEILPEEDALAEVFVDERSPLSTVGQVRQSQDTEQGDI